MSQNEPRDEGPTVHDLKCWPEFFDAVADGSKPFEVRFDTRDIAEGETIRLREWEPTAAGYTGRSLTVEVTYRLALDDAPGYASEGVDLSGEWVVLGIRLRADGTEPVAPGEQAVEPHEIPRSDLVDSELVKDLFREVRAAHLDPPLFPAGVGRQFCGSCGVVLVSVEDGCQACGAQSSSEWMTCPHGACLERVYVAGTECVRCESAVDQCPGCEAPLWTEHVNECWNCGQTLIDYGPQFRQPPHPAFPPSAHVAIQIARLRGDTTQQQLADRLGVTQPTVSQWESHKRRVSLDDLPAIARALSCRVSDLLPPEEATDA